MESLSGKAVIVTGGNSGIGEGIALKFASLGSKICIAGRNADRLEQVAKKCREISTPTTEVLTVCGDIRDEKHRKDLVERTVNQFGKIDLLVNNAGISFAKDISNISQQEYSDIFDTNVKASIFLTQLAIPHLKQSKGSVINNSSVAAARPLCAVGVYCMSKAALDMFTMCLANDLGPHGVRVNSINPGIVQTPVYKNTFGLTEEEITKIYDGQASLTPLRRTGTSNECAEVVAFLASDAASFVTGQQFYVDGGRGIQSLDLKDGLTSTAS